MDALPEPKEGSYKMPHYLIRKLLIEEIYLHAG